MTEQAHIFSRDGSSLSQKTQYIGGCRTYIEIPVTGSREILGYIVLEGLCSGIDQAHYEYEEFDIP